MMMWRDIPFRGRGILGSGWQMQTDLVESRESPELSLLCIGFIVSASDPCSSFVSSIVSAARLPVVRTGDDGSAVGSPPPSCMALLGCSERSDLVDVDPDVFRVALEILLFFAYPVLDASSASLSIGSFAGFGVDFELAAGDDSLPDTLLVLGGRTSIVDIGPGYC